MPIEYRFDNLKSRCRPVSPDDLPIVGNLQSAKNVYVHNGLGGFGNIAIGTSAILADMIAEDVNGTESVTRARYKYLSPARFDL